jgi:hypothetical protein
MIQDPNITRVIKTELLPLLKQISDLQEEVKELKKILKKDFHESKIIPKQSSSSKDRQDDIIQNDIVQDSKNDLWDSPPMGGFKNW